MVTLLSNGVYLRNGKDLIEATSPEAQALMQWPLMILLM